MKKLLVSLLAFTLIFSFSGCAKNNQNNNSDYENTVDIGGLDVGSIDMSGIETYDSVPETTVDVSFFESFKLENIDNFSESDMSKIADFSEEDLKAITAKKEKLLNKLTAAFKDSGINVSINETSGEISLDSSVLFGGDSAELSSNGKSFLKKFISVYTSVVFNDEFNGFISKILVEGHTAPLAGSTYESGLPLSEERANNVKAYCLSSESGISSDYITELSSFLESVGLSNSKPVKDASGNVDINASRRVTFRFLINLDK